MNENKSPSYPWYPGDFQRDEPVQLMSLEEEGAYRRLLDHQWLHGSIPSDVAQLARICKNLPVMKMRKLWAAIAPCFVACPDSEGRVFNRKLERVRSEREAYRQQQAESGRRGGQKRWAKEKARNSEPSSEPTSEPIPTLVANGLPSSAMSSASASSGTTQTTNARSRDGSTPIGYAQQCTGACNRGLRENPAYAGGGFNELATSDQLEYASAWFAAGIPVDFAAGYLLARAREFKPNSRFAQPVNLKYFDKGVRGAWENSLASESASDVTPIRVEERDDDDIMAAARRAQRKREMAGGAS